MLLTQQTGPERGVNQSLDGLLVRLSRQMIGPTLAFLGKLPRKMKPHLRGNRPRRGISRLTHPINATATHHPAPYKVAPRSPIHLSGSAIVATATKIGLDPRPAHPATYLLHRDTAHTPAWSDPSTPPPTTPAAPGFP